MTGHTSDEVIGDGSGHARGTDADSATKTPNQDRGVVQDSPGNPDYGTADDAGGNGNLTGEERPHPEQE
ncbi:hypothetical protein [Deinococcus aquiradiocola]|uniref:Uncharacterized protein n=1 Tax=Deinococcus aquiradiocola TaxID=393059 RepID=A0A917UR84_9DEIO|nr:hypothetical protein [Deinococcus aquiradiocola]GGJ79571.1 hypothetical protein GCM10008939_24290 [Deinococcus aquiradiocola]